MDSDNYICGYCAQQGDWLFVARRTAHCSRRRNAATGLVAPKGAVLYATCSIERGENEAQVKRLASNFGLSLVVERTIMPAGLPGEPASLYRDGGYHALLALA